MQLQDEAAIQDYNTLGADLLMALRQSAPDIDWHIATYQEYARLYPDDIHNASAPLRVAIMPRLGNQAQDAFRKPYSELVDRQWEFISSLATDVRYSFRLPQRWDSSA